MILVVERDPHIRELESHLLEKAGFDVELADDGDTAREAVAELRPSVVVPEASGRMARARFASMTDAIIRPDVELPGRPHRTVPVMKARAIDPSLAARSMEIHGQGIRVFDRDAAGG